MTGKRRARNVTHLGRQSRVQTAARLLPAKNEPARARYRYQIFDLM